MKKKKAIYLMLPVIILVWGVVFYQLFSYFFSEPNYAKKEPVIKVDVDEIQTDTFSIVANYRDPFLGKKVTKVYSTNPENNSRLSKTNKPKTTTSKPTEKSWPTIAFKGMIKNNNSDKRVGIVSINGKEQLVREGDVVNEVVIISIKKESVKVKFQKELKEINI